MEKKNTPLNHFTVIYKQSRIVKTRRENEDKAEVGTANKGR